MPTWSGVMTEDTPAVRLRDSHLDGLGSTNITGVFLEDSVLIMRPTWTVRDCASWDMT
jgi:hypothetical protein